MDESAVGLVPAIVQHAKTKEILMLGFANEEALKNTRQSKLATFFSRSRNELWIKGSTSGNFLHVSKILTDCDRDAVIYVATPDGPTCHTGTTSCFSKESAMWDYCADK